MWATGLRHILGGWGYGGVQLYPKTTYPKPPIWILKVLISNSAYQQRGKVSPFQLGDSYVSSI